MNSVKALGEYLRKLREKRGVSIRQVERETGIANAYLSLLETGSKMHLPPPEVLNKLADYYNVSVQELLEKTGYLQKQEVGEKLEERIEKAFLHVINDPNYRYGTRAKGKLGPEAKRFIIEMYERATGRKLL